MFAGIVEEVGTVVAADITASGSLRLRAPRLAGSLGGGDSLAVDGCCLTVVAVEPPEVATEVMPETARRTSLGGLAVRAQVNLERALALGDRIGGHLLTGHVDSVATVTEVRDEGIARWLRLDAPVALMPLLAPRGSVALGGISLTVVRVAESSFEVSLIPHTLEATTAGRWGPGTEVNLEADLIARYVERALSSLGQSGSELAG